MFRKLISLGLCVIVLSGCGQATPSFTAQPQPTVHNLSSITTSQSLVKPSIAFPTVVPTATLTPTFAPTSTALAFPALPVNGFIASLPAACPKVGSQSYQEEIPAEIFRLGQLSPALMLERKYILLVKNASDQVNGDTSSPVGLLASPGQDGISLREALMAARTTAVGVAIRFDPGLKGAVISVGSWDHNELPPLDGGSVTLNGDVDGDGQPDITLKDVVFPPEEKRSAFGLRIESSDNLLYALMTIGFSNPVFIFAPGKNQIYTGNVIANMVFEGGSGIGFTGMHGNDPDPIEETHNTWKDTWIINNTFHSKGGIAVGLTRSIGDLIDGLVIKDNRIEIASDDPNDVFEGINLVSGGGTTSTGNLIENVVILNNTVLGNPWVAFGFGAGGNNLAGDNTIRKVYLVGNTLKLKDPNITITQGIQISTGFWINKAGNTISDFVVMDNTIEGINNNSLMLISSGSVGSSMNTIERIRISRNHFISLSPVIPGDGGITALSLVTGDGATDYTDPSYQPVVYPDYNVLRDVWITGNTFTGQGGPAVSLGTGDPGSQHNEISNIYILGNNIDGFFPGAGFNNGGVLLYLGGKGDDRIQHVVIQQNTIRQVNQRTEFNGEEFVSGGVMLTAGNGTQNSFIKDVTVVGNLIDVPVPGINLVGGFSLGQMKPTTGNSISQIHLWCNVIVTTPTMLLSYFPSVKGINLAGGFGATNDNLVTDIEVKQNMVVGVRDDISVFDNAGAGSTNNAVNYDGE